MFYVRNITTLIFFCFALLIPSWASAQPASQQPILNKISLQLSVEKWAQTDTAKVTVSLDGALDKIGLANISSQMMQTLDKMAGKTDWHITQFMRSQDKSGLETVHVEAEARLPETDLADLRNKAKNLSKPGETYTVTNIDFSPSAEEIEKTHAVTRAEIYNLVKQEIARINQIYPDQQYFLYSIDFQAGQTFQPVAMRAMAVSEAVAEAAPQVGVAVSTKVVETAQAVIAAITKTPPLQMMVLPAEGSGKVPATK